MDNNELQKAQNIIDVLFYDDRALTQWQHALLEQVINAAQDSVRQQPVRGRKEHLKEFIKWVGDGNSFDDEGNAEKIVTEYLNQPTP